MKASKLIRNLTEFIRVNGDMDVFVKQSRLDRCKESVGFEKQVMLTFKVEDIEELNPLGVTSKDVIVIRGEDEKGL